MIRLPLLSGFAIAAVQTSRGTFEFKDGVPNQETSRALYDQHDFTFA